ncbi:MAG: sulfotransferase family protein, partial [Pseudolabrys sp.]
YAATVKIETGDPIIQKAEKLIGAADIPDTDLMHLHFAMAKAQDDLGNSELSLHHLMRGNAIRKKDLGYDVTRDEQLFAAIKRFFDFETVARQAEPVSDSFATPIFILGMPRSGTTLVEQIVSSHSTVFGAGELAMLNEAVGNSGWQIEKDRQGVFGAVRSFYNQNISEISDSPFVTDKMPLNFRWIGFIMEALPEARIVHVKREPAAVCWSNFKTYFPSEGLRFAFDMQDIAKFYRLYDGLMDFWHGKYPGRIYDLNYEALTENQEEETRKLFGYLQLGWEDDVLAFHRNKRSVTTASDIQVRQAMYRGSSREWEKYRQWLSPMLAILNA